MNPPTIYVKSIDRCNRLFSTRTSHPLVSVIRLNSGVELSGSLCFGFYSVWLRPDAACCPTCYGRQEFDFCDGMLISLPPGRTVERDLWSGKSCGLGGRVLCFHPTLFDPLAAGSSTRRYSFFRYATNESLHLSHRERMILERELNGIEEELNWGIDESSQLILSGRIRLMLDYVTRFYQRQFILRHDANVALLRRTDADLEDFFRSGLACRMPLPGAADLAGRFGCSTDYFDDLLACETGKTSQAYVTAKRLSEAERLLKCAHNRPEEVARQLGFPTDYDFCRAFRKLGGRDACCHLPKTDSGPLN